LLEDSLVLSRSRSRRMGPLDLGIVGVDDGAFDTSRGDRRAILLAVLLRCSRICGVKVGTIEVDGNDAPIILRELLRSIRFDLVMLSGISFGGFNLIDVSELAHDLHKPVIAISGEKPNNRSVRAALRGHFDDWENRWRIVRSAGKIYSCKPLTSEPRVYFEVKGANSNFAKRVIAATALISRLPEPVRVARILARGLSPYTASINA